MSACCDHDQLSLSSLSHLFHISHISIVLQVPADELVGRLKVSELTMFSFVHVEQLDECANPQMCYIRMAAPLLRLLAMDEYVNSFFEGRNLICQPQDLIRLFDIDRVSELKDYYVRKRQRMRFRVACTAYLMLTPENRPELAEVAALWPTTAEDIMYYDEYKQAMARLKG